MEAKIESEVPSMTFLELASTRYSVRAYKADPIPQETLDTILQAGRIAPTACNYQPQKIFVVQNPELRAKLAECSPCTFDAPTILVVCYDKDREAESRMMPGYTFGEMDSTIVCTHMMLQAWELGIGTCWVGLFNDDAVSKALDLPENLQVAALLPMGYPADGSKPSVKHSDIRPAEETIVYL